MKIKTLGSHLMSNRFECEGFRAVRNEIDVCKHADGFEFWQL